MKGMTKLENVNLKLWPVNVTEIQNKTKQKQRINKSCRNYRMVAEGGVNVSNRTTTQNAFLLAGWDAAWLINHWIKPIRSSKLLSWILFYQQFLYIGSFLVGINVYSVHSYILYPFLKFFFHTALFLIFQACFFQVPGQPAKAFTTTQESMYTLTMAASFFIQSGWPNTSLEALLVVVVSPHHCLQAHLWGCRVTAYLWLTSILSWSIHEPVLCSFPPTIRLCRAHSTPLHSMTQ